MSPTKQSPGTDTFTAGFHQTWKTKQNKTGADVSQKYP